jgi:uncharacterized membrane-anchored protein
MTFPALLSSAAAVLSVLISLVLFFGNDKNQARSAELQRGQAELQTEQQQFQLQQQQIQAQQQVINTANQLQQQVGPAVIADLKTLAKENKNDKIKNLLTKYGVALEEPAPAADKEKDAAKGATPAPSTGTKPAGTTKP